MEELPLSQQQKLLAHLQSMLAPATLKSGDREAWLRRLDELRSRTKPVGASAQVVLDEIRADRF